MSGNPDEILDLDSLNRYMVDVQIADPQTGNTCLIPCEIDTGSPKGFAIPDSYDDAFSLMLGKSHLGGAGKGESRVYQGEILQIESTPCSHLTSIYVALDSDTHDYGLLGIEFLRMCISKIHNGPDHPVLELELEHVP